jgi:hydrogenase maturation protein HypF
VTATGADRRVRQRIRIEGIVQGVGFRPFVYALAARYCLAGIVGNDARGVFVEVEGAPDAVAGFREAVERESPPLAVIERISSERAAPTGTSGFVVVPSPPGGERQALISPDTATCADCLRELYDPTDRRYRYPFVNCTNCGPRFTIVRDVPYDRSATTMAQFPMCPACAAEYHDPSDRRFHAQPVCCPACGPTLSLVDADGRRLDGADPLESAADLLRSGAIVAVKGLGGYHLAADATSESAVGALRSRKHREDKPFAVMVADVAAARRWCDVDAEEEPVLVGPRRPIVLLHRRGGDDGLAAAVAPGNRFLGLMLPYTPLHHLLTAAVGGPFVLTSGNVSDEPIAYEDADALARLAGIADAFLLHDRRIHVRTDDSVVRVFDGRELPVRRSRGYAPQPLRLARPVPRPVLGCGAELKHTFCLAKGAHAFLSHHVGDLENYATLRAFTENVAHFRRLFDIEPLVVAHDLHPDYLSTKYAVDLPAADRIAVQHHHAHIASCLVDNGVDGPVIGVAFDGLGYGTDGTFWGGEFLVADLVHADRAGFLEPVPMPGGAAAIRQPWRMALAYLDAIEAADAPGDLAVRARHAARWDAVAAVARAGVNSPLTSSAGRLFDAVAALIGVRDEINYEGQAAVELEQRVDPTTSGGYRATVTDGTPFHVCGTDLFRAALHDVRSGLPVGTVAARFHRGVAASVVDASVRVRAETGLSTVALSGGVFQNLVLLRDTVDGLCAQGFEVLTHHRVPPNDAGISLGQVAVAAARDRAAAA